MLLAVLTLSGAVRSRRLVETTLRFPVPFRAQLNLGSWLERLALVAGGYEDQLPGLLGELWQHAGGEGCVLDVGANVGLISIPTALAIGKETRLRPVVCAIEPVPDNFQALEGNVSRNALREEVRLLQVALGEKRGQVRIQVEGGRGAGEGTGTANVLPGPPPLRETAVPVEVETIDRLREQELVPSRVSVIKLDTDGYDLKVLEGARLTLERDRPAIFGEFDEHSLAKQGQGWTELRTLAHASGYGVFYKAVRAGWRFRPATGPGFGQDLLLLPLEALGRFAWCLDDARD